LAAVHVARSVSRGWDWASAWIPALAMGEGEEDWVEELYWSGVLRPGERVFVRNMNGPIVVQAAEGDSVVVIAEKGRRRWGPDRARVEVVPHPGGVTFCAVWSMHEGGCGPAGDYQILEHSHNPLAVRFTVHVPSGVGVDLATVNGAVEVDGVTAAVKASTTNGRVRGTVRRAPFRAATTNGSIDVTLESLASRQTGDIVLETVNGTILASLVAPVNARIEASTVHGRIESDIPIPVSGKLSARRLAGQLGRGGPRVTLKTVNGSIHVNDAGAHAPDGFELPALPELPELPQAPELPQPPEPPPAR
jgi:hypothetical protein